LAQLLKATGFGISLPANLPDLKRVDDFLEAINGDGKAILDYIKTLRQGKQEGEITIARILSEAEQSILHPVVTGIRFTPPEPKQEETPQEGGIVIYRW
jgi:hypothetical protein